MVTVIYQFNICDVFNFDWITFCWIYIYYDNIEPLKQKR